MAKRPKKKSKSGKNRTGLAGHRLLGKKLLPPFSQVEDKVTFTSWGNQRLPEMLWAVIIRALGDQKQSITEFRRILAFVGHHEQKELFFDLGHTGIAALPRDLRRQLITHIVANPTTAEALTVLTLFEHLPAGEDWLDLLPKNKPDVELLLWAVGSTLGHQSQEATDCRWVRLMGRLLSGKFHVPRDMAETWLKYPDEGDQREVRPSIRAAEMADSPLEPPDSTWADNFWTEGWRNTPCLEFFETDAPDIPVVAVDRQSLAAVRDALGSHWKATHLTTAIDARHDAVFGLAFYALRIVDEILGIGIGVGILGRLALRTILEVYLSLHFLLAKDEPSLWKKWRTFGAGQAKLNALRFDSDMDPPKYIKSELLEQIAGEDLWEEFLTIELGSWSGIDLRRLSERSGTKQTYDAHYSWTSGYVHGTWGPVRESCFKTCGNPLHRFHRFPRTENLPDTVVDAVSLVNSILDDLSKAYPAFHERLGKRNDKITDK